jgi:hypothetical protein
MKKVMMSEDSYNKLKERILEGKFDSINEISYGTVDKAYDRSDELFNDVINSFNDFYETLKDAIWKSKYDDENNRFYGKVNSYLEKIMQMAEPIDDILCKKMSQQNKFFDATTGSVDHNKFYDSSDGQENDIDDMELQYLHQNYPKK